MANRSYLYSVDTVPELDNPPIPIRGISEHNWSVPLIHMLLVGRDPKVCQSMIWGDHTIGIVADFAAGVDLTTRFLHTLMEVDSSEQPKITEAARPIIGFLADPAQAGRYFVLEAGEILDIDDLPLDEGVERLVNDIPYAVKQAEEAIAGERVDWLVDVAAHWPDHIGSSFSDVLYFHFPRTDRP